VRLSSFVGGGARMSAGLAVALSLAAAPALADVTKDQCIDANGRAQHLRTDGKLLEARDQLRICANPACPAIVRSDCTKRIDELEAAQPTIAFEAKDGAGADLVAVKVTVDGKPLADKVDGTPLQVDPGQHVFTFEIAGQPPVTRTLVLTEGVKGRHEQIVLGPALAPAPAPTPPPPAAGLPETEPAVASGGGGMGTQKILGLAAGGVGVAGLVVGGVFGAMTLSEKSQQQSACGSPCSPASHAQAVNDHSSGMTDSTISTIGFIAGGALVVGGAVLFFTAHPSSQQPSTGVLFTPSVGPGGGGLLLQGKF
jgi:hypothetical protein